MRFRFLLFAAVAALVAVPAISASSDRSTSAVFSFADGSAIDGAWSTLVRTDHGASFTVHTNGLTEGDAVTVWWIVFNEPEDCITGQQTGGPFRCGELDLGFGAPDAANTSVFWATGHVVNGNNVTFAGYTTTDGPKGQILWGPGLVNPRTADIHFVVRTHGPALPEFLPLQFMSFGGACGNAPPSLGGGGPNTCEDLQFAVHEVLS